MVSWGFSRESSSEKNQAMNAWPSENQPFLLGLSRCQIRYGLSRSHKNKNKTVRSGKPWPSNTRGLRVLGMIALSIPCIVRSWLGSPQDADFCSKTCRCHGHGFFIWDDHTSPSCEASLWGIPTKKKTPWFQASNRGRNETSQVNHHWISRSITTGSHPVSRLYGSHVRFVIGLPSMWSSISIHWDFPWNIHHPASLSIPIKPWKPPYLLGKKRKPVIQAPGALGPFHFRPHRRPHLPDALVQLIPPKGTA